MLIVMQVSNKKFCNLGLNPTTLEEGLLDEVVKIAQKYKDRCIRSKILPSSYWNRLTARRANEKLIDESSDDI